MKKLKRNTLLLSLALFVSIVGLERLTRPITISYKDAVATSIVSDNQLKISFKDEVSKYKIFETSVENEKNIVAYQTILSKLFQNDSTELVIDARNLSRIYYEDGMFSGRDIIMFGDELDDVSVTLPRLALNYYTVLSMFIFMLTSVLHRLIKQDNHKKILSVILVISGSYVGSSFLIKGINGSSYFMIRDLSYILLSSAVLSVGLISSLKKATMNNSFHLKP